jgi:hypothetical protein
MVRFGMSRWDVISHATHCLGTNNADCNKQYRRHTSVCGARRDHAAQASRSEGAPAVPSSPGHADGSPQQVSHRLQRLHASMMEGSVLRVTTL